MHTPPAILMSHASATSSPPPSAVPSMAAITGTGRSARSETVFLSRLTKGPTSSSFISALSLRSAPEQKVPGTSLLRITPLTLKSCFSCARHSSIWDL